MADVDIRIRTIDQTGQGIRSIESKLKGFVSTIGTVTAGVTVMAGVFKKAFDFAEQGAQLEFIETKFNRLAVSIGSDSDTILAALTEVTRGTMTTAQMMDTASQIISLGLGKNEEDVVRLASLVTNLGWDMQQVILTFANDSKMRLDALGLSVEDVTARAKEFEKAGYDASRAFDLAVLAAGEDKLRLVGSAADSGVGSFQRLRVMVGEFTDELKRSLADGLLPWAQAAAGDNGRQIEEQIQARIEAARSMTGLIDLARDLSQGMEGLGDNVTGTSQEMAAGLEEVLKRIARQTTGWEEYRRALYEAGITGNEATEIFYREIEALVELEDAAERVRLATSRHEIAQQRDAEASNALTTATEATSGAYDHMIPLAINLNEKMKDYGENTLPTVRANQEALAAALEASSQRILEVAENTGRYFTEQMNAERGAGLLTQAISDLGQHWVQINGRTQQQNEDLERITDAYERVTDQIHDYEIGLRGAGMEEDERAEAMQALYDEAARLQGIMQPLVDITGEYQAVTVRATFSGEAAASMLYEMAGGSGASAEKMAELGVVLGEVSPEMAQAGLQAALLQAKIQEVATAFADGKIKAEEARDMVADFVDELNGVAEPAGSAAAAIDEGPTRASRELSEKMQIASDTAKSLADRLTALVGDYNANVNVTYNTIGEPPPGLGGGAVGGQNAGGGGNGNSGGNGRAVGGPVRADTPYLVGENGPETFVPWTSGTILANQGTGGGGITINNYFSYPPPNPGAWAEQAAVELGNKMRG